jgi:O-antigen ligase
MPLPLETLVESGTRPPPAPSLRQRLDRANWPVAVLAFMMFVVPALGVPSELMLQDTLKSALVAFGVLIAALVFFWQQRGRTAPLLWHGLVWLPLALTAYALGSMVWSHTYLAGVEAIRWFLLSLLLWLGLNTLTRDNLPNLVWGIHLGAVVASVWIALQFWFDFGLFPQGPQPASTFINRNFFAEYAVCALPFSVWLLATMRSSRWLGAMTLSIVLNVAALMMTGTRSALVALLLLAPVFAVILVRYRQQFACWRWSKVQKTLVGLVLAIGIGALGSIPTGNAQIIKEGSGTTALQRSFLRTASMAKPTEYTEGSFSIRSQMWMATARMMLANPLTGVGAGAWEVQIPLYQRTYTTLETDYYAHNEFLQLLSEYGVLVGGLVLAFLLAYLLHAAGRTWQLRGDDIQEAPLRAFTLASLLALLIVSNAGFPWHLAGCGALLSLGLAILAGSDARLGQQERFFATSLRWRPVYAQSALVLLMCCTVLAGYITCQAAQAERKIVRAIKLAALITQFGASNTRASADAKAELLQDIREGLDFNPHYRKLTSMVADLLAAGGDMGNPNVVVIWSNLAYGYSQLGQHERAKQALQQVQRLKPEAIGTRTLQVVLLNRAGHEEQAAQLLNHYFKSGLYDYGSVQAGYSIGLEAHNWPLAIQSLKLLIQTWPEQAADGYFRLGSIYANPELRDDAKALVAFKAGLAAVPVEQKENYSKQIPARYRAPN